jgi:hypothetical protein
MSERVMTSRLLSNLVIVELATSAISFTSFPDVGIILMIGRMQESLSHLQDFIYFSWKGALLKFLKFGDILWTYLIAENIHSRLKSGISFQDVSISDYEVTMQCSSSIASLEFFILKNFFIYGIIEDNDYKNDSKMFSTRIYTECSLNIFYLWLN